MITPKEKTFNMVFILPALVLFLVFNFYPLVRTFQLSFFQWNGIDKDMVFIGFAQYKDILFNNPAFWKSMLNAGYVTLLALTLQNGLALLLALLVNRQIRGENIYRVIFFLPPVLSGIVVGLIWKFVYDGNFGILNHWLIALGFDNFKDFAWLSEVKTALSSVAVVHMWRGFGYGFIILLAGLQTIPNELYEAAEVDGADKWQQFKHITFPCMIPVFTVVTILTILGTMQIFDLIYSMTRGGPAGYTHVPITKIYEYMSNGEFGYSTAMAVLFGMVLLIVSFGQLYVSKKFTGK
ncbi:MAG: sugar ABC transporter permease [Endomicrobiaceae bacterium]|nr:sugar ABC transporter permease [Endomicrobiaceae bacterium]